MALKNHVSLVVFFFIIANSLLAQNSLSAFSILEGNWQMKNTGIIESWKYENNCWYGEVVNTRIKDNSPIEALRIFEEENTIFYEATVADQNNGQPIRFKLVLANINEFIFENTAHDFPQKIHYFFKSKNELEVTISNDSKKGVFYYLKDQ